MLCWGESTLPNFFQAKAEAFIVGEIAFGMGTPSGVPNIHVFRVVCLKVDASIGAHRVLGCGWNQSCNWVRIVAQW